jgi:hypothetical protein
MSFTMYSLELSDCGQHFLLATQEERYLANGSLES